MDLRTSLGFIWVSCWLAVFFIMNNITSLRSNCRELQHPLDDRIPFLGSTSVIYFSTYLIFVLPLFLIQDLRHFIQVLVVYTVVALISNFVFLVYPTRVFRQETLPNEHIGHMSLGLFQRVCKPYNSFPSMHTAYALCAAVAVWRFRDPWLGGVFAVWAVAIAISTLTAKQHVLLDVMGGVLLGLAASVAVYLRGIPWPLP
jgi:membrane-associated phospholipid phosphatase